MIQTDQNMIGKTVLVSDDSFKGGGRITVYFDNAHSFTFNGKHLPGLEKPNWHYYQTDDGYMIHCRKEHMVCVIEKTE